MTTRKILLTAKEIYEYYTYVSLGNTSKTVLPENAFVPLTMDLAPHTIQQIENQFPEITSFSKVDPVKYFYDVVQSKYGYFVIFEYTVSFDDLLKQGLGLYTSLNNKIYSVSLLLDKCIITTISEDAQETYTVPIDKLNYVLESIQPDIYSWTTKHYDYWYK